MSASGGSVGSRVKSMPGLNPGFAPATPSRNSSCGKRKPAGSRRPLARCHAMNVRSAALLRASGPAAQWLTSPDHPPELAEERAMMPLDLFTDDPRWAAWRTELRGDKATKVRRSALPRQCIRSDVSPARRRNSMSGCQRHRYPGEFIVFAIGASGGKIGMALAGRGAEQRADISGAGLDGIRPKAVQIGPKAAEPAYTRS